MKKVYFLKEENGDIPRYVGLTKQDLKLRRENHLSDFRGNTHKIKWIQYCKENNIKIEIVLIGEWDDDFAKQQEEYWIRYYWERRIPILNEKAGWIHTEEFKDRMRDKFLGRSYSKKTLKRMKAAQMRKAKKVFANGKLFNSIREAANKLGLSKGFVCGCCKGNKKYKYEIKYA